MNAQVAGLEEGDRVQVEYSVPAKISYTAEEEKARATPASGS